MTTVENFLFKIFNFQKHPGVDITETVALTGSLTALSSTQRECMAVTIVNATGSNSTVACNSSTGIVIPDGGVITFSVTDMRNIKVSGSGTLGYIVTLQR